MPDRALPRGVSFRDAAREANLNVSTVHRAVLREDPNYRWIHPIIERLSAEFQEKEKQLTKDLSTIRDALSRRAVKKSYVTSYLGTQMTSLNQWLSGNTRPRDYMLPAIHELATKLRAENP